VAEPFEARFDALLRATLKAEAAAVPVAIRPADVLQRRELRRRDRPGGWTRLLAAAVSRVHGEGTWRAERAPLRLSPILMLLVLSLLLALALAVVTVGSLVPNLWISVLPSPTAGVPSARLVVGPAPAGPPQAGALTLVSSDQGARRGLVMMDPDSGVTRALTPPLIEMLEGNGCVRGTDLNVERTALVTDMTWSPDGRALVFQLAVGRVEQSEPRPSCGLFVASSDGQSLIRVLSAPDWEAPAHYSPAWAPDGSQIAVALGQSIALVQLDGADLVDMGRPCDNCQPVFLASIGGWSADGSMIAAQFVDADDATSYIAIVDVTTGKWTPLWSGPTQVNVGYELIGWLRDGRVAAFASEGVLAARSDEPGEWTEVPSLGPTVDAGGERQLGLWSPDQTRSALRPSSPGDGLRLRDLTTGRIESIADWVGVHPLAWSPDGERLAVVRTVARELWLIDADGGNPRHVASGSEFSLAWQPVWAAQDSEP
jgi:hypothetical protein